MHGVFDARAEPKLSWEEQLRRHEQIVQERDDLEDRVRKLEKEILEWQALADEKDDLVEETDNKLKRETIQRRFSHVIHRMRSSNLKAKLEDLREDEAEQEWLEFEQMAKHAADAEEQKKLACTKIKEMRREVCILQEENNDLRKERTCLREQLGMAESHAQRLQVEVRDLKDELEQIQLKASMQQLSPSLAKCFGKRSRPQSLSWELAMSDDKPADDFGDTSNPDDAPDGIPLLHILRKQSRNLLQS
mmetsp:Transcript_41727/g.77794  ORF Transcript_41727/g.77794 Transcript_41727/m.77794 type:complete len:248 (+) Transcript_41727:121-864(+)